MALPNPIAYWNFDEGSGTTAADSSGNNHTATLVNGTWDTSALKKFGNAALKNTDVSRAASFTPFSLGTVYSISCWINGWDGANDGVIVGGGSGYNVYVDNIYLYHGAGPSNFIRQAFGTLIGSHHIAVARNGTSVTLYKDGSALINALLTTNNAETLGSIGAYDDGTFPFVGTIDDLRFYNIELTSSQITELYNLVPTASGPNYSPSTQYGQISAGLVTTFAPNVVMSLPCTELIMFSVDTSAYERSLTPDFANTVPVAFDTNKQAILHGGYIRNKSGSNSNAIFKRRK